MTLPIEDRLGSYTDRELATLRANAERLAEQGSVKQKAEAEKLLPLLDAELADRKAKAPVKTVAKRGKAKSAS
ncbi:MAG: hypothetical protein K2P58_14380 [Hyphomonadaceae bacterium]|nr:hypothetical protein [Hyphomonadaceae bacterium]